MGYENTIKMKAKGIISKRIYFDKEQNCMIGLFDVKNKGKNYINVSITALAGMRKNQINCTISDFYRIVEMINRMPEIKIDEKTKKV